MMRRRLISSFSSHVLWAFIFAGSSFPAICRAQVVINEVYYDHPGRDDGWEFIELHNGDTVHANLAGYSLEIIDGTSAQATIVWTASSNLSIEPGGRICVAGALRHPPSDFLLRGSLGNGPDAVRLVRAGAAVDLVGYGELARSDLSESTPAADVEPGASLARRPDGVDTDRNGVDFVPASPSPGRANFYARDLALSVASGDPLPCKGAPLSVLVALVNEGIEPFDGAAALLAEASSEGLPVASGRAERDIVLAASGSDSLIISVPVPPRERFRVRVLLSSELDENRSNDTAAVTIATSPGIVIVNEIMYRPRVGESEWIELACLGALPCNIKGWSLCDATRRARLVSDGDLVISPGAFLILAEDSAAFAARYLDCPAPVRRIAGGWPSLNDVDRGEVAETIDLVDSSGILIERASYRNLMGSERGRSIERVMGSACSSSSGSIWHRSADRAGATPGMENSARSETVPNGGSIDIRPNPFRTRAVRETVISGRVRAGETGFLVRVFDLGGKEVKRLFGEDGGSEIFACRWDGRADDGSPVRTGLYVCLVEFVRTGGGVCRTERKCVAVASD